MKSLSWVRGACSALLLVAVFAAAAPAGETGDIWGTVGLEMPNGTYYILK